MDWIFFNRRTFQTSHQFSGIFRRVYKAMCPLQDQSHLVIFFCFFARRSKSSHIPFRALFRSLFLLLFARSQLFHPLYTFLQVALSNLIIAALRVPPRVVETRLFQEHIDSSQHFLCRMRFFLNPDFLSNINL